MFQRIFTAYRSFANRTGQRGRAKRWAFLDLTALEGRALPAAGFFPTVDAPLIVAVADAAPAVSDLADATPIVRMDLMARGGSTRPDADQAHDEWCKVAGGDGEFVGTKKATDQDADASAADLELSEEELVLLDEIFAAEDQQARA